MYKILYIISTFALTGPNKQLFNIINNLDRKRFHPVVLTLSQEKGSSIRANFININVEIHSLNLSRISGLFLLKNSLKKFIKRTKPHLIQTMGIRADIVVHKIGFTIPTILTLRSNPLYDYKSRYGKVLGTFMSKKHLYVIKNTKNVIACSQSLSLQIEKLVNKKIDYIQNAVDTNKYYKETNEKKNEIRRELKLKSADKIFIYIGPLDKGKNIPTLIKAFLCLNNLKNIKLLIVGDGPDKEELLRLSLSVNSIRLVGKVHDVIKYYQCADYFISASQFEGLPNAVLEAMSCGLPVILSDIAPHKEIFDTFSSYPYFFNFKDYKKLAKLMDAINKDDYAKLSNIVMDIVSRKFTVENNAQQYMGRYNKYLKA